MLFLEYSSISLAWSNYLSKAKSASSCYKLIILKRLSIWVYKFCFSNIHLNIQNFIILCKSQYLLLTNNIHINIALTQFNICVQNHWSMLIFYPWQVCRHWSHVAFDILIIFEYLLTFLLAILLPVIKWSTQICLHIKSKIIIRNNQEHHC
jgi:hypothetical protein